MLKRKNPPHIINRLLFLFAVIVLPIVAFGILGQIKISTSIRSNTLLSFSDRLNDMINQIDQSFTTSYELTSSLFTDARLMRIANPNDPMSAYDRSININYTRRLLTSIKLSNPHISNVCLYLPQTGVCYNAENAYDYDRNRYLGSQHELTESDYSELSLLRSSEKIVQIHNDNLVFLQYSSLNNPYAIVEVVYMLPQLKSLFGDTLFYEDSLYFFSLDSFDYHVTNCTDPQIVQALPLSSDTSVSRLALNGTVYYAFYSDLLSGEGTYVQLIPERSLFMNMNFLSRYTVIFTVGVLLCAACFILGTIQIIRKPVQDLTQSLQQVEQKNFDVTLNMPDTSDFQYLYDAFNRMTAQLRRLIQQELQHEILINQAQLKQLQAQINPHFLYNSFFMLNQMVVREMYDDAKELTRELGQYFKYITRNYDDVVSLADEYEHTHMYANIQAKRFAARINIRMENLPEQFASLSTPKLILQPILENAFCYSMENKIRDGLLDISFTPLPDRIIISISDNGDSLDDETLRSMQKKLMQASAHTIQTEMTGLLNIFKRLQLYYGRSDVMSLSRSSLGGLRVSLTLFLHKEDDHVQTSDC